MNVEITQMQYGGGDSPVQVIDLSELSGGSGHRPLSEKEAVEIVEMDDPILRNLRITLGYHDLLLGMARLLGSHNVSWPAFACWASRTAGSFIRGEYIPDSVQSYLAKLKLLYQGMHTAHRVLLGVRRQAPPPSSIFESIVERVSREVTVNVSWGNHMVFQDIGPLYARMIETFEHATTYDQQAIDRFLSRLEPGRPEDDGQDLLIAAFGNYYKAMFERDPKKKAELILLANNRVGLHEQTRLQPAIEGSMNAPIADLITKAARARARELTHERMHSWIDRQIDRVLDHLSDRLKSEWQAISTSWFMHLQLPDTQWPDKIGTPRRIKVGRGVPPRCEHSDFPPELGQLDNVYLKALLYDLDQTPNTVEGSMPQAWGRLEDRMNYLVDLFRTQQQYPLLYRQPFTDNQIVAMRSGEIPPGHL